MEEKFLKLLPLNTLRWPIGWAPECHLLDLSTSGRNVCLCHHKYGLSRFQLFWDCSIKTRSIDHKEHLSPQGLEPCPESGSGYPRTLEARLSPHCGICPERMHACPEACILLPAPNPNISELTAIFRSPPGRLSLRDVHPLLQDKERR